jgi:hypothetical protein
MKTTLYDAEYVLSTIIASLDGNGQFDDLDWPAEVKKNANLLSIFRDLLGIIRGILLGNVEFKNNYCGKDTADNEANKALKNLCTAIDALDAKIAKTTLDAYCTALSSLRKRILALGGGFAVDHDLVDLAGILYDLVGKCENYRKTCRSLEALHLIANLTAVNDDLKKFKGNLDTIASTSDTVAEAATFLAKAVAVLAKVLVLL